MALGWGGGGGSLHLGLGRAAGGKPAGVKNMWGGSLLVCETCAGVWESV